MSDMLRTMGTAMTPDAATRAGVPGGIVEFPENVPPAGSKPMDEGMPSGGLGGMMQTVGKFASNPLLLAALKGYAGALGMPRGAGPITRIAGGVSSGLEDYFIGAPYRQTMTEKAKAQTEKEKMSTQKTKEEMDARQHLPPDLKTRVQAGGNIDTALEQQQKSKDHQLKNQALAKAYTAEADATADPKKKQILMDIGKSLSDAGDADVGDMTGIAKAIRAGDMDQARMLHMQKMEEISAQNAATSAAHLGLAEQGLGLQRQKEGREAEQAKVLQGQNAERLDLAKQRAVQSADKSVVDTAHKQYQDQGTWKRNAPVALGGGKTEQQFEEEARQRQGAAPQPHATPQPGADQKYVINSGPHKGEVVTLAILQQRKAADPSYGQVDVDPVR